MRVAAAATRAAENEREDRLEQKRVAAAAFRAAENEKRENRVEQKQVAAATFRAAETEEQRENRVEQIQPIKTKDRLKHFEMFSILKWISFNKNDTM